jgi:phosphoribosylformylglycinamidine cyclo-ligase
MEKMDYKNSGVNIDAGEEAVRRIKPLVKKTFNENVLTQIGGFGGLYQLDLEHWKKPVLVSSADGVGTKLMVARMANKFDTVGQDLVNHCVDDIFVQGAHPQFFLDYIGVGELDPDQIEQVIGGFSKACVENGLALIGGEMAEMPGIYKPGDFDLVGTIVGLVERDEIITGDDVVEGDVLLGLRSTGLHTNGYSLARKIIFEKMGMSIEDKIPGTDETVAEALLAVHKSYYPVLKKWAKPTMIHGMAHITGGGLPGNLKRSIPDGLTAKVDCTSWETPALFKFLQNAGNVDAYEMHRAFNMGIGFVVIVPRDVADQIKNEIDVVEIGSVVKASSDEKVELCF